MQGNDSGATLVCLVRHGATDWNEAGRLHGHTDIPLNETGVRQAEAVARRLAQERWTALWTSDLRRAHRTAELIGQAIGLVPRVSVALRERHLGDLEGLTFAELRERFPGYPSADIPVPGVESRSQVRERAMSILDEFARRYPGGRIIAVSHGALINGALAAISGGEVGSGKTRLHNACINVVVRDGSGWRIETINDVSHLVSAAAP